MMMMMPSSFSSIDLGAVGELQKFDTLITLNMALTYWF